MSKAEKLREYNEALAEKQKEFEKKAQEFQQLLSGEIDMDKVVLETEREQERLLERRAVVNEKQSKQSEEFKGIEEQRMKITQEAEDVL